MNVNDRTNFWTWEMLGMYASKGSPPRTHETMKAMFGRSRPGKTAQDRARKNKGRVSC